VIVRVPTFIEEAIAPGNRQKLWFGIWTGFAVAAGFGALALVAAVCGLTPWRWAYLALVSTKVLTNALAALALSKDRGILATQTLNIAADVLVLTGAVYFTGGVYSPLLSAYVIIVAVLSLLANLGVTILVASMIVLAFGAMMFAMTLGILPPTPVPGAPGHAPTLAHTLIGIVYCGIVVGVPAWFSAATLRVLRVKERALEARTAQLIGVNAQRSQFVASMTHELRTPIHGVQGLADVIAAGVYGPVTDKQKEACASIKRSAQGLLALVDDVLNLARAEADRIETRPADIDVVALIDRVTASVSWMVGTKQIELEAVVERGLPTVRSDDRWLAHVLVNLVANAVKFTPEGGHVTVQARHRPDRDAVALEVIDTGIGIARDHFARIFEPFRQVDGSDEKGFGGVGLGLALVAKLTALLGASVELDSEVGKGSTFRVLVPVAWRGRQASRMMRAVTPVPADES
jgi:signal transduction histidine kinase